MFISVTPLSDHGGGVAAPPDIIWSGTVGDFALDSERGLKSTQPLETSIIILLFTDAPADEADMRFEHGGDFRGWPGDALGDQPLGSKLWLYRRRELNAKTAMLIEAEIKRALAPLLDGDVVARIDATATANPGENRVDAAIRIYGRDGTRRYAAQFELLWQGR